MQALPIAFPWGGRWAGGTPGRMRANFEDSTALGIDALTTSPRPDRKNRQPELRLAVESRFDQSVRYRWSITTTCARVALDRGERVLSVTPEMMPWLTAQVMALVAQELTFPLSA